MDQLPFSARLVLMRDEYPDLDEKVITRLTYLEEKYETIRMYAPTLIMIALLVGLFFGMILGQSLEHFRDAAMLQQSLALP